MSHKGHSKKAHRGMMHPSDAAVNISHGAVAHMLGGANMEKKIEKKMVGRK
jgi:sarcosine oxidase gamma subunit